MLPGAPVLQREVQVQREEWGAEAPPLSLGPCVVLFLDHRSQRFSDVTVGNSCAFAGF